MRTNKAKFEFRKIAHIDYIIFLWRGWEILKFESLSLICREVLCMMYLENCIPNEKLYKYFIIRHPRILIERLIFLNNKNKFLNIVYDTR